MGASNTVALTHAAAITLASSIATAFDVVLATTIADAMPMPLPLFLPLFFLLRCPRSCCCCPCCCPRRRCCCCHCHDTPLLLPSCPHSCHRRCCRPCHCSCHNILPCFPRSSSSHCCPSHHHVAPTFAYITVAADFLVDCYVPTAADSVAGPCSLLLPLILMLIVGCFLPTYFDC